LKDAGCFILAIKPTSIDTPVDIDDSKVDINDINNGIIEARANKHSEVESTTDKNEKKSMKVHLYIYLCIYIYICIFIYQFMYVISYEKFTYTYINVHTSLILFIQGKINREGAQRLASLSSKMDEMEAEEGTYVNLYIHSVLIYICVHVFTYLYLYTLFLFYIHIHPMSLLSR
jgi:hypothetical protein